jgi:hypothetical protein
MSQSLTFEREIHFRRRERGRRELDSGPQPSLPAIKPGRVPRVARLMALAIRFDRLIREGAIADYTELAALSHVTRARISQIMNLLNLATDIQEAILFLPRTQRGRDSIILRDLQPIAAAADWRKQRVMWQELITGVASNENS